MTIPTHQLDILQRMKVPMMLAETVSQVEKADLIVDGLIGYRLKGAPLLAFDTPFPGQSQSH